MKTLKTVCEKEIIGWIDYDDGFVCTSYRIYRFKNNEYAKTALFGYMKLDEYVNMCPFVKVYYF